MEIGGNSYGIEYWRTVHLHEEPGALFAVVVVRDQVMKVDLKAMRSSLSAPLPPYLKSIAPDGMVHPGWNPSGPITPVRYTW